MLSTYDKFIDEWRRADLGLRRLEAHYRKEAVCEPGCTHSQDAPLCSRFSQQQRISPRITGSEATGEAA